jgi:hypothetical protein
MLNSQTEMAPAAGIKRHTLEALITPCKLWVARLGTSGRTYMRLIESSATSAGSAGR